MSKYLESLSEYNWNCVFDYEAVLSKHSFNVSEVCVIPCISSVANLWTLDFDLFEYLSQ